MNQIIENLINHLFVIDELMPLLNQQIDSKNKSDQIKQMHISIKMLFQYKTFEMSEVEHLLKDENYLLRYLVTKSAHLISSDMTIFDMKKLENTIAYNSKDSSVSILKFSPYICSVRNTNFRGASHPYMLGTIFINEERTQSLIEKDLSIIHEMAHQELFLLNMLDRLVKSDNSHVLIHSPYQGKERPAIGRLHSAHALFRMIQLCNYQRNILKSNEFKTILDDTIKTLGEDDLTSLGKQLKQIYKEVL